MILLGMGFGGHIGALEIGWLAQSRLNALFVPYDFGAGLTDGEGSESSPEMNLFLLEHCPANTITLDKSNSSLFCFENSPSLSNQT